jgi:hypothetical protein
VRPADLGARDKRLERRQDDRLDIAIERVALVEPGPVRAQRVEEAGPDRTCVADADPDADDLPKSGSLQASATAWLYQATWNGWARSRPAGIHRD